MRGTHYGTDYVWFTRFIGDDVALPPVTSDPKKVEQILAERGIQPSFDDVMGGDDARPNEKDLHKVTGTEPASYTDPDEEPLNDSVYPHGSLKAAIARSRARAKKLAAELSQDGTGNTGNTGAQRGHRVGARGQPDQDSHAEPPPEQVSPEVAQLARLIKNSVSPRELARFSFEDLLAAFRAARLPPGAGAKLVQSWAYGNQLSPEEVVRALKRAKDEWLARAHSQPVKPSVAASPKDWNYDAVVADTLNQRQNVGRGPKDIDRERLMLLRRLMASFSGQANYGFSGDDAVVEAAGGADILAS